MITTTKLKKINSIVIKDRILKALWSLGRTVLLVGLAYLILYPILVKISVSFMSYSDMNDLSVRWIPRSPTLDNFKQVLYMIDYPEYFFTTLLDAILITVLQMLSCTLAGYGFAKFNFKFKKLLFFFVIFTLVIPQQAYGVSSFMMFRNFDFFGIGSLFNWSGGSLLNTPWPGIILSIGCQGTKNGLFIYIMKLFFEKLPKELEESAWIDGAGVFKTFTKIMLPNTTPALITIGVLSFVWRWNDLYFASTYTPKTKLMSLILSQLSYQVTHMIGMSNAGKEYISMITNAGALLIVLPLVIFFLLIQRMFVEGVEHTGLSGA